MLLRHPKHLNRGIAPMRFCAILPTLALLLTGAAMADQPANLLSVAAGSQIPDQTFGSPSRSLTMADGIVDPEIGDINQDGIGYTVSDMAMFGYYMIYGLDAFAVITGIPDPIGAATTSSDINEDGVPLTVEDFAYLVLVMYGQAYPGTPPYPQPVPNPVVFSMSAGQQLVLYDGEYDLLAIRIVLDGVCDVGKAVTGSSLLTNQDSDSTVVFIYHTGHQANTEIRSGPILTITTPGCGQLRNVTAATVQGNKVNCEIGAFTNIVESSNQRPEGFVLRQNYPNPFNPSTTIEFALPEASDVTLVIYNVMGQQIRTLSGGRLSAGDHSVVWDGRDDHGSPVASGAYLYHITAGAYTHSQKMLLLK